MLGDLVRTHRRRLGMTQEELTAAAGISVRSIRKLEAGRVQRPRPSTLRALADAFELSGQARDLFYLATVGPAEADPAAGNGAQHADPAGEPLLVVAIDTTTRGPDDAVHIQVRVRTAAGEYSAGPFPVVAAEILAPSAP